MNYLSITSTTLLILIAVSIPGSQLPQTGFNGLDKLVHVFIFFVWSLSAQFDSSTKFRWNRILMAGVAYGFLTELLQLQVKSRSFDWIDWIFDSLGVILAALIGPWVLTRIENLWPFRWLKGLKTN